MNSAIFEGQVRHRRMHPTGHEFVYRLFMMYLDLSELDTVFEKRWFWSTRRSALARFRRENHLGDTSVSLDRAVRDLVEAETGSRPKGPIRLLTNLSYFGYCFNPVSFYYCFDAADEEVEFIVAEINNTPWHEQHCYVLDCRDGAGSETSGWLFEFDKRFHVSPFMPMQQRYRWRLWAPAQRLRVRMENLENEEVVFGASMVLRERALDSSGLARVLLRYPLMTAQVIAAIHWQALRLWAKGVPVHDHPKQLQITKVSQ